MTTATQTAIASRETGFAGIVLAVGLGFGAAIATGRLFIGIVIGELALVSLWAALVGF